MISVVRTAVILVLVIHFLELLGGGKEYGHFTRLVTGLLIACSLAAALFQLTGTLSEDTWLSWLEQETDSVGEFVEENSSSLQDAEENAENNADDIAMMVEIEVPLVEEIPKIEVEEIQVGEGKRTQSE